MPIKVLVVDDSALIRHILSEIVTREPALTLVGAAPDALHLPHPPALKNPTPLGVSQRYNHQEPPANNPRQRPAHHLWTP